MSQQHHARTYSSDALADRLRERGVATAAIRAAVQEAKRTQARPPEVQRLGIPAWAWPPNLTRNAAPTPTSTII